MCRRPGLVASQCLLKGQHSGGMGIDGKETRKGYWGNRENVERLLQSPVSSANNYRLLSMNTSFSKRVAC